MSLEQVTQGFRLSPQQLRLWHLYGPQSSSRCVLQVDVPEFFQTTLLSRNIELAVVRHEILRTTFRVLPGLTTPLQVIAEKGTWCLNFCDLSAHPPTRRSEELKRLFDVEWQRPANLERGPSLCVTSIRLSEKQSVLQLSVPALVSDLIGLRQLASELVAETQTGRLADESQSQYADVAEALNETLDEVESSDARRFWLERLERGLEGLEFADINQQPSTGNPASVPLILPANLQLRLFNLAGSSRGRLQAWLLAAFQAVLNRRMSADAGMIVGVVVPGRDHALMKNSVGCFSLCLPAAIPYSKGESFHDVVTRSLNELQQIEAHQHYFSWERLSEAVGRNQARCYAKWGFAYEESDELAAIRKERFTADRFDVQISFTKRRDELTGLLFFDDSRVSRSEATTLSRQVATLLHSSVSDLELSLSLLPIMDDEENEALARYACREKKAFSSNSLPSSIRSVAAETPEAVAVSSDSEQLSYARLDSSSNQVARALEHHHVQSGTVIGVRMQRSIKLPVALLGVLKSGAAYLPLDPDYPEERLQHMIATSGVSIVLTDEGLEVGGMLTEDWTQISVRDVSVPAITIEPESLAYVIFTSGSTGVPKGVAVTHRALTNHMAWMKEEFSFDATDVILQKTPFSFDASVWEFWAPLLSGGRMVMLPVGFPRNAEAVGRFIVTHNITVVQMVPTLLRAVLEYSDFSGALRLRLLLCGGETMSASLADEIHTKLPHTEIVNLYGPTEVTIDATFWRGRRWYGDGSVPIGYPISNIEAYVLDEEFSLCPIGAPGELCLGGAGLARGYLQQSELTAERFVPNPFSAEGQRLYRTGDMVRRNADGCLEFLGRVDHQVKIRGYRIELGEIESVLARYEDIRNSVVVEYKSGQESALAAYVVTRSGQSIESEALRDFLMKFLPDFMIPSTFIDLKELPLLPNGKVDRKALPAAEVKARDYVPPSTDLERVICNVWAHLLGLDVIGMSDNFFERGGHSLLATRVVVQIQELFAVELRLRSLFEKPTPAGIVEVLTMDSAEKDRLDRAAYLILQVHALDEDGISEALAEMESEVR